MVDFVGVVDHADSAVCPAPHSGRGGLCMVFDGSDCSAGHERIAENEAVHNPAPVSDHSSVFALANDAYLVAHDVGLLDSVALLGEDALVAHRSLAPGYFAPSELGSTWHLRLVDAVGECHSLIGSRFGHDQVLALMVSCPVHERGRWCLDLMDQRGGGPSRRLGDWN